MPTATLNVVESYLCEWGVQYRTEITRAVSGKEQRQSRWTTGLKKFALKFSMITDEKVLTLWDFFVARKGKYEAFYYRWHLFKQHVGWGTGAISLFTLHDPPIVTTTDKVYLNEVLKTRTVDYTIVDLTGAITFASPVPSGVHVEASYDTDLYMRFDTDYAGFQEMTAALFSTGIPVVGVKV